MKHSINCEHKDNDQENSIKDCSFIFFISSSPFCRFQNLFLDPAAKSFVNFVQICVSSDTETQFCKKDSSCHVHQNVLFRQQCRDKHKNCQHCRHSLVPYRNFFSSADAQIAEPADQTMNRRKQIICCINRVQPQSKLIP